MRRAAEVCAGFTRPTLLPTWRSCVAAAATSCMLLWISACAGPTPPRWQVEAASASERFVEAWLVGDQRVEQIEFDRARERVTRTGRPDLVARIELLRCAARIAALVIEPCVGFDALEEVLAVGPETAYADYLSGRLPYTASGRIALLPAAQQGIAALPPAFGTAETAQAEAALAAIDDPLSQLVAAGVLMRTARTADAMVARAIETASRQGWRRALLAWLTLQKQRAAAIGDQVSAAHAQRRIDLIAPQRKNLEPR